MTYFQYQIGVKMIIYHISAESKSLMSNSRGIGASNQELPEWKKHVIGGKKSSFGMKTHMSIKEQRESLPIYKLKDELIKVYYMPFQLLSCFFFFQIIELNICTAVFNFRL